MGNADWEVRSGEMKCCLVTLAEEGEEGVTKEVEIELRCRYRCVQPELDDIYSPYSNVVTFGATFVGCVVYIAAMLVIGGIGEEDMERVPMVGHTFIRILRRVGVFKTPTENES